MPYRLVVLLGSLALAAVFAAAGVAGQISSVRNVAGVWFVTQLLLLVLVKVLHCEWTRQLRRNIATIEQLSERNVLLLNSAADGICGVDSIGNITFINRAALTMHGYQLEEVLGKNPHELFHHHLPDGSANSGDGCPFLQSIHDGQPRVSEEWLVRRDGSGFPAQVSITPIFEGGKRNGAVVVLHDITEQRNRQEALLQLATTDSLTGACNRRHFLDQLDMELSRQRRHGGRASILMTDLDYFKNINDKYGHATGDAVLSHFVRIVRQTVRRGDIVGRVGGEEFAILLPGDDTSGARELAERLRRTFESTPTSMGAQSIPCTVSIGISNLRTEDMTADVCMNRADIALYAAKAAGRNCVVIFDPSSPDFCKQETATTDC